MAILGSTTTSIVVFLPVFFVEGLAGQIFRDMALTVGFSLLASLAVALTIVPILSRRLHAHPGGTDHGNHLLRQAGPALPADIRSDHQRPWPVWMASTGACLAMPCGTAGGSSSIGVLAFIAVSYRSSSGLKMDFMSQGTPNEFSISLTLPSGRVLGGDRPGLPGV